LKDEENVRSVKVDMICLPH